MRLWVAVLIVAASGCSRWSGVTAARKDVVREALAEQRFPLDAYSSAQRLKGFSSCTPAADGTLRCSGCLGASCFELVDDPEGGTRVVGADRLTEVQALERVWKVLDPVSLREFRLELPARVDRKLLELDAQFEPRWGLTGGLLAGLSTSTFGLTYGLRLGLRRWFDARWLAHTALEYRVGAGHEFGLRVGLEFSRWTEGRLWGVLGVPPASVSVFSGPLLTLGLSGFGPTTAGWGARTGLGVHVTDLSSAPMFAELTADTVFSGSSSRVNYSFTVGIGF